VASRKDWIVAGKSSLPNDRPQQVIIIAYFIFIVVSMVLSAVLLFWLLVGLNVNFQGIKPKFYVNIRTRM